MKKIKNHHVCCPRTLRAKGLGKGMRLSWPLGQLLCILLLLGSSCQQRIAATDHVAAVLPKESKIAVQPEEGTTLSPTDSQVVNGIHVPTGLIADSGYLLVRNNCSSCHSLDLVKNKRATREGWLSTIRWMQQTQGLWALGANEKPILDYLAKNYAPEDAGRRRQLKEVEWHLLKE